jgi:hypothetical protein
MFIDEAVSDSGIIRKARGLELEAKKDDNVYCLVRPLGSNAFITIARLPNGQRGARAKAVPKSANRRNNLISRRLF